MENKIYRPVGFGSGLFIFQNSSFAYFLDSDGQWWDPATLGGLNWSGLVQSGTYYIISLMLLQGSASVT